MQAPNGQLIRAESFKTATIFTRNSQSAENGGRFQEAWGTGPITVYSCQDGGEKGKRGGGTAASLLSVIKANDCGNAADIVTGSSVALGCLS